MDTGGLLCIPMGRIPDSEMSEFLYPMLTLWRREEPDSGGAGRHRGGVSASLAVTPHGTSLPIGLVLASNGKAVSQNRGLSGGYPGNTGVDILVRGTSMKSLFGGGKIPSTLEELDERGGKRELGQNYAHSYIAPGEVFYMHWQGGGGYGDPLRREPAAVVSDVAEQRVTAGAARSLYGVVLGGDGALDEKGTTAARESLRSERKERSQVKGGASAKGATSERVLDLAHARRLDDNLVEVHADGGHLIGCAHCGQQLGDARADAELALARYEGKSTDAGPSVMSDPSAYVDAAVVFRQLSCPRCATAIFSSVVPANHPDHAIQLAELVPVGAAGAPAT